MKQIDFSQFKYRFVEEALKLLESLEYDTLRLEKDNAGGGFVDGIMRVMHTLKGVSSMYGFHQIEVLTHQLESMYSAFQTGEIDQSDEINDITLVAIDHLRCLLTDETGSSTENIETHNKLLKRIYKLIGESANQAPVTIVKTHEEAQRKMQSWYIMLTINDSIILRGVKLLRIFRDLSAIGQYEIVKHSYSTTDEKTEEIWGVYLVTDANVDQIEDVFLLIPDNCKITPVSNCNIFDENYYLEGCQSNETREISLFDSITSISQQISNEAANHDTDLVPDVSFLDGIIAITQQNNNSISNNETNAIQIDNKEYIKSKSQRISVDAQKLDELMYLVSELIINKERLVVATTNELYDRLPTITEQLDKLSKRFRDITLDIRLVPIEDLVLRFKRLVRDLSKGLNKQVELITDGIETELDKNLLDLLAEPFMHLIRNCIDHGIEQPDERLKNGKSEAGTISFKAFHSGNDIIVEISDDGSGINYQKIKQKAIEKNILKPTDNPTDDVLLNLIFLPGFSTALSLSEVSGRGIGMEVVKRKITEAKGDIKIHTETGRGTKFTIRLHQTVSIIDTLLIKVQNIYFALPLSEVVSCSQIHRQQIFDPHNRIVPFAGDLIPYLSLRDAFKVTDAAPAQQRLIIISIDGNNYALLADKIIGEHQAVIKPLGNIFNDLDFLSGVSVLGDGKLAFLLNPVKLLKLVA